LATISSVRHLVNGTPCVLDSITVTNDVDLDAMHNAYQVGYSEDIVTFESMPLAVNVVVGGKKDNPVLWHEVSVVPHSPYSFRS
jgi:hypothetical protein